MLATRAPGYVLHAGEVDARRFEALAVEGQRVLAAGDATRTPVGAALREQAITGRVVCIVSGGNIDLSTLAPILLDEAR